MGHAHSHPTLRIASLHWLGLAVCIAQGTALAADVAACKACHGPAGISASDAFPNLAGQKMDYLVRQLEAFKSGTRKNDLIAAIAGQLSPEGMQALALYWSQMPAAPATPLAPTPIAPRMGFPADFPSGFTLYQTLHDAANGQVTKRYANAAALRAARDDKPLPSGAAIVGATHAALLDAAQNPVLGRDGQPLPGTLLSYAAMAARDGWGADVPELLRNGDWGYALFTAVRVRRDAVNQAPCLAWHKPLAADSFVFTMTALKAAGESMPR